MQKYFNIVKITTTMDMTVGSRYEDWVFIEEDVLTPGAMFSDIHGYDLLVESVDEKEMVFRFKDRTYKINRWWQVLGTPEFDVSNKCVSGQARFVFHFSNHPESSHEWNEDEYAGLASEMMDNVEEGNFWKNIPLARKFIHVLKDIAPFRCGRVNPAFKAHLISVLLKNDFIQKQDAPRLFQSYCELYRLYLDYDCSSDYDEELSKEFDKSYFKDVDRWIYNLAWIIDDPSRDYSIICWNGIGSCLKADIVQATEKWEEVIYDVEKEVDEELKDENRGMGFCHAYWSAKRAALARRGIEWRSPAAMNPRVMFD